MSPTSSGALSDLLLALGAASPAGSQTLARALDPGFGDSCV